MVYIESHQELGAHPKTRKLARLLGISRVQVVGHLHFLWWWAMDYADDGDLTRFTDLDIALGAEWEGDEGSFVVALTDAGFLDSDRRIHDWEHYAGKLIERRRANAARMREARAKDSGTRAPHVHSTLRARAELPDLTVPKQTKDNPDDDIARARAKKRSSSSLLTILDGSFPAISADFTALNSTLSASWLRDVLATASDEVPELPKDRLGEALIAAHNQAEYTFAHPSQSHPINNPMGYVKKLILDEVRGAAE